MVDRIEGDWEGGKLGGGLYKRKWDYMVKFHRDATYFAFSMYGGEENAYLEALKFQTDESEKRDATKNRYRFVKENGKVYMEVQLQKKLDGSRYIMKCDIKDIGLVLDYFWHACKPKKGYTYYVVQSNVLKMKETRFHKSIFPNYEIVDHINGDGFDNRRENLRDGKNGVNNRNQRMRKTNTSGVTGVSYHRWNNYEYWVCSYADIDGNYRQESFGIQKYGYEQAKKLAIDFRMEQNQKTGNTNGERLRVV